MEKDNATKTSSLIERINQNENFQSFDINEWAFDKIKGSNNKLNVLELCCGNGKQTGYLLKCFPNAHLSCLDISAESIALVKKNNSAEAARMTFYCEPIDDFFEKNKTLFDLVFCSYGLYYSSNINKVLARINKGLNPGGRLIVMGPYGINNKPLFDVLTGLGVTIAEPVISSSSTFMSEVILPFCIANFSDMHIYTAENKIAWNTVDSVMNYWKSSTFYAKDKEAAFENIIKAEIDRTGKFVNHKNIMLLESIKHG